MTDEITGKGQLNPASIQNQTVSLTIEELALLTGGSRARTAGLPPRSQTHQRKNRWSHNAKQRASSQSLQIPSQKNVDLTTAESDYSQAVQEADAAPATLARRIAKQVKRVAAAVLGVAFFAALLFWAKFAYVYNIPDFMSQETAVNGAAGYICYKPWWFGSPVFSLRQLIKDNGGQNDRVSLQNILHDDKAVIDNPIVLWRYYHH